MSTLAKLIYVNEAGFYHVYVISDNHSTHLSALKVLIKIIRKSFPSLKEDDIWFTIVTKSSWCKNMPIARATLFDFEGNLPKGWKLLPMSKMDFSFA
jgi:hypothetical protein